MSKYPELSDADKMIMEILWEHGECGSKDVLKEIQPNLGWTRQTVRTYLVRLVEKGLVKTKEISKRSYLYYPNVTKEQYAADQAGNVVEKYYGSVPHLLAGLLKHEDFTDSELDELERIITEARKQEKR